ncbi:MAG: sodium:calcium antiporter [Elusimicrobia bacterium]|nr:sodium:calcium antiporter [Elusimicrobiota bacterium]
MGRTERASSAARSLFFILLAAAASLQWVLQRCVGFHPPQPWTAFLPGLSIFGAAFLLTWAAEAAEMDIPQNISIAILALIAVLPEYAVDIYFAWEAGKNPAYTSYATANMTGANRLLIGFGWPAVLLACWWSRGIRDIHLSENNAVELSTLLLATLYAFVLPFKATLSIVDTAIFLSLFAFYTYLSSKAQVKEPELEEGPAKLIAHLPKNPRRFTIGGIFLFSALAIGLSAEPFAEGLLEAGKHWGIEEFLLVQWLAPLASEAPEFIVAILFSLKGKPEIGLRALVSSKVNQWTLLIGMLPAAFALSSRSLMPMHLDARQVEEIFLTSAQSFFGLVVLMNLSFSFAEAISLLILFSAQLFFPQASVRYIFAVAYILLGIGMLVKQRGRRGQMWRLVRRMLQ